MTAQQVIEKVEAYKMKIVANALYKAKEEYQNAKCSYNDTGYDRYYNKMNKLEKTIEELEAYAHIGRFDLLYIEPDERIKSDVLDKIRAEIRKLDDINPDYPMDRTIHISRNEVLEIIDKYRQEE